MSIVGFGVLRGNTMIAYYGDKEQEKEIIKMSHSYSGKTEQRLTSHYLYSFLGSTSLTYVCVVPSDSDKIQPLKLLDTISRRWAAFVGQKSTTAESHSLDQELYNNFHQIFEEYESPNKANEIKRQLEATEEIMKDNMNKAITRGNHLVDIDGKSQVLFDTSEEFKQTATNLKWTMRCSYYKSLAIKIIIGLIVLYFVLSFICGGMNLKPRCIKSE